jgi:hypothetical protein
MRGHDFTSWFLASNQAENLTAGAKSRNKYLMNCRHWPVSGRIAPATGRAAGHSAAGFGDHPLSAPLVRTRSPLTSNFHQPIENVWRLRLSVE